MEEFSIWGDERYDFKTKLLYLLNKNVIDKIKKIKLNNNYIKYWINYKKDYSESMIVVSQSKYLMT